MRYWQHIETGRLLKIDVLMIPEKWTEITKEQYDIANEISTAELLRISEEKMKNVESGKYL